MLLKKKSYPTLWQINFFEKARIRKELKNIIFLGGSQGAKFINDLALNLAPELQKKALISFINVEKRA